MLRLPYDAGSEADVWQSWINESIMEHNELMADPAAPAADDAIMKWESFREDYQGLDGKLQVLHGLRVYFSKTYEVWESGHREWNNKTRRVLEMTWNLTEMKVWKRWKIVPIESESEKKKQVLPFTMEEMDRALDEAEREVAEWWEERRRLRRRYN